MIFKIEFKYKRKTRCSQRSLCISVVNVLRFMVGVIDVLAKVQKLTAKKTKGAEAPFVFNLCNLLAKTGCDASTSYRGPSYLAIGCTCTSQKSGVLACNTAITAPAESRLFHWL